MTGNFDLDANWNKLQADLKNNAWYVLFIGGIVLILVRLFKIRIWKGKRRIYRRRRTGNRYYRRRYYRRRRR